MTLAPGSTLGPYTILAELGHGGMGVVSTAHDPRLKRQVAINTADLTRDETAKQRFLQEALHLSVVSPLACSGDMYAAVPTVWPVCAGRETPCLSVRRRLC